MDTILEATAPAASPTTAIAAVNNNNSVGSNNSSSSGYGSATATPVNTGNCYDSPSTTSVSAATVSAAEYSIPVATIAAVTPFYNEAITATESQRQQYYQQSYGYSIGAGYTQSLQQKYNAYDSYIGGGNFQHASNIMERNGSRYASAHTPIEKLSSISKTTPNLQQHIGGVSSTNNMYKHSGSNGCESNIATKPQAAATPFYSQPLHSANAAVAAGYFDAYKYKMPGKMSSPTSPPEYPPNYGNHLSNAAAAVAATYQQQQYYVASKSLQDSNYAAAVKSPISATNPRHQQHQLTPSYYSGSNGSYYDQYDKYMYTQPGTISATTLPGTPINPAPYPHPPSHPSHYPPHETGNENYRKTSSWHWSMEYAAGNCRSLPPPSSGIPTATVPPTNASYLPQTSSPRDPLYTHEKYGKYDKYNPYFHQQQYAMQTATRNTWPSSHHSHLSSISERIPHTHPQPPPPSLAHHFPSSNSAAAAAAVNARQNCCSQPFQQQNCYYPRAPHIISNAFPPHPPPQQPHYSGGGSGSNASKYGSISDYTHHTNKLKNSSDLYVSSQQFEAANLNFNYPATSNHRYPNTVAAASHQPLNSTAPALLGDPTTYYNDLNLHSSTFDNYATAIQTPQTQLHIATTRSQHFQPYPRQHSTSLLDYRKPSTTQNTDCYISQSAMTNLEDHIAAGTSNYSNYDIASNMITTPLYNNNNVNIESSEKTGTTKSLNLRDFLSTWNEDEEDYGASNELSFIETPESQPLEQSVISLQSDMPGIENVTASYACENSSTSQTPENIAEHQLHFKGSFNTKPKIVVGITVDSAVDVESSQYINLPDIVIDIEKSTANTAAPLLPQTSPQIKDIPFESFDVEKELDELQIKKAKLCVEKQIAVSDSKLNENRSIEYLHEYETETSEDLKAESNHLNSKDNNFKGLLIKAADHENVVAEKSYEYGNIITTNTDSTNLCIRRKPEVNENSSDNNNGDFVETTAPIDQESTFDNPEQYLKDIEYDNTSHSNESTFEKEYETFINKIGSDTPTSTSSDIKNIAENEADSILNSEMVQDLSIQKDISSDNCDKEIIPTAINEEIKRNSESDLELAQNIKNFSKFYKRKRKIIENELQDMQTIPKYKTNDSINDTEKAENFPKAYTKKCRKRKELERETSQAGMIRIKYIKKSETFRDKKRKKKRKPLSLYYKTLHSLRRFHFGSIKLNRTSLLQQHIAMLKERHLPLIKRQSIKKYSSKTKSQIYFNPKTLKCLSVSIVNTEAFRLSLLKDIQSEVDNFISDHRGTQLNKVLIKYNRNQLQMEKDSEDFDNDFHEKRSNACKENVSEEELNFQRDNLFETETHFEMRSGKCEKNCIKRRYPSQEEFNTEYFKENESPQQTSRNDEINVNKYIGSIETVCQSKEDANRDDGTGLIDIENKVVINQYSLLSEEQVENKEFSEGINKHVNEINENSNSRCGSSYSTGSNLGESSTETRSSDEDTRSSISVEKNDFNELEELEKELSQINPLNEGKVYDASVMGTGTETLKTELVLPLFNDDAHSPQVGKKLTNNDHIANLKKLLECDNEEHDDKSNEILNVPNNCEIYVNESITNSLWSTEFDQNMVKEEKYNVGLEEFSRGSKRNDGEDVERVDDLQVADVSEENLDYEDNEEEIATSIVSESKREIQSLKFMAESFLDTLKIAKYNMNKRLDQSEVRNVGNVEYVIVPKLSDLCKIALNSCFESSELTININDSSGMQKPIDRELSVEEALAEMYRQAGVASDPEDYDVDDRDAQDVLLINLEEILVSDSDLYVLQCDMNENVLSVITHSDEDSNDRPENAGKLNTMQLVELLNSNDLNERHEHENDISIFNTTDSNVIVINESDTSSITFLQSSAATTIPTTPPLSLKNHSITSAPNEENSDSLTSQFDLPTIHHEEIVPDNYNNFEKENFIKYLHGKYVLKNISKFHHSNRILKKYKRRRLTKKV